MNIAAIWKWLWGRKRVLLIGALVCMLVLAVLIGGVVLFILAAVRKKFRCEAGEVMIPKQLRWSIVIANSGMVAFLLAWAGMILLQMAG